MYGESLPDINYLQYLINKKPPSACFRTTNMAVFCLWSVSLSILEGQSSVVFQLLAKLHEIHKMIMFSGNHQDWLIEHHIPLTVLAKYFHQNLFYEKYYRMRIEDIVLAVTDTLTSTTKCCRQAVTVHARKTLLFTLEIGKVFLEHLPSSK